MKKLVIFDLDGTLLNTITDLGAACNNALMKNALPTHELSRYPFLVGNGIKKLIERAVPVDLQNETSVIEQLLTDFREYYDEHNCDFTEPYDGIPQLLKSLTEKGIKVAVTSNKYDQATKVLVKHFFPEVKFSAVFGQREGVPTKPDPTIIFDVIAKTEIAKQDILYVGDSGVDMETAYRACVDSAGVTWGFRSEMELRSKQATYIVDDPSQILEIALSNDRLLRFDSNL